MNAPLRRVQTDTMAARKKKQPRARRDTGVAGSMNLTIAALQEERSKTKMDRQTTAAALEDEELACLRPKRVSDVSKESDGTLPPIDCSEGDEEEDFGNPTSCAF